MLEGRPSNPKDISFAPECFEQMETRTEYSVVCSVLLNRLSDKRINLNDGNPLHKIQIERR